MKTVVSAGQPSWLFASDKIEAMITQQGGHLAPVTFRLGDKSVQPFSVAPWAEQKIGADDPAVLKSCRGDFFCAPFGGNEEAWRGERHPPHGESANSLWQFESLGEKAGVTELHLSLSTKMREGRVDKFIELRHGQTALYCRHVISGMAGPMNLGHHAILKFPDVPGAGRISSSRIRFGQVLPTVFEEPEKRGYSSLQPGAVFSRLDRVAKADGTMADLSRYPARRGFEDLVMFTHEARPDFAWTAVCFPKERYVWFALKDPRVLRSTVFWISNGGRHYAPWNGRHVNVLGVEDVTSFFHYGLAASVRPNSFSKRDIPTTLTLTPKTPLTVNYIMAVVKVPRGFERVRAITRGAGEVTLSSTTGKRVTVPLDASFISGKTNVSA